MSRRGSVLRQSSSLRQSVIEALETRQMLSVNVLSYRDGAMGVNSNETALSPANVKVGSFGKLYTTPLDGQVYAEPLVVSNENISSGVNTPAGNAGVHNVVYVETENDSIYAVDTSNGGILWHRSFLSTTGTGTTPGTDISNPLGATAIIAPTSTDVSCTDITPCYGITGTPIIDLPDNRMYVVAFTEETVKGVQTFVQRIHAINLSDGTDQVVPYQIGTTTGTNTNTTSIYVYGDGDGAVTDPYNQTGNPVVQFNALRENERSSLALVNGTLYINWASHCDDFPYHGWVVSWNVANLTTSGFQMTGVFCTSPNGGGAGVWGGGGGLAFDPDEANTFYLETGNGFGQGDGISLNAEGFPNGGAYFEAVVKLVNDPTTTATSQNTNGWGMKVTDYFIPYNQAPLDNADQDLGSGSPLVLPDSAGIAGHPHLLLAAGKQGVVYVIDRDNMGHYNTVNDDVLNSVPNGNGNDTPPVSVTGVLSSPVYFNGTIYYISGYSGPAESFTLSSTGMLVAKSQSAQSSFGYLPGSPTLSSNGNLNGIIWQLDRADNELHAYDANSYATELWNSNQAAGSADAVGSVIKFSSPTVANGEVFVGTADSLVIYGLQPPVNGVPATPTLSSQAISSNSIQLSWVDPTVAPNTTTAYSIEELIAGVWTPVTTAPGGTTSIAIGGLAPLTSYSFRIRGLNGVGYSGYSPVTSATTTNAIMALNFAGGFNNASSQLSLNGSAVLSGTALQLTTVSGPQQTSSVFSNSPVSVSGFSTHFNFQESSGTATADGFTFTIQSGSPTAIGVTGEGLGYQGINNSIGVKFDLYNNAGEGTDSTGLYLNGALPTTPSVDMTSSGVNLHSGDLMQAVLAYDGTTLSETVTDLATNSVFSTQYAVNIPSYTGALAYVGFTGATGGEFSTQRILNWTFTPNATKAPAAPSALGVTVASATSINLNWTANDTDQTGYLLDRATDSGFTQNLVTQSLPATPAAFTDTYVGLASGGTYFYRIRAVNALGSSANSNVASISIPFAPAKATDCEFDSVTTTSISIQWIDNAGPTATGYHILRSVNSGTYTLYATLPGVPQSLPGPYTPTEYDWTDTGCTPGTYYDYHIQCFNVAGYNDFVGGNATTLTPAPTGVTAVAAASTTITIAWTAQPNAVSYNIYRGNASGGESTTPIATGITTTSYVDSTAPVGASYYYVTAVNGNIAPLNSESAPSTEVNATLTATKLTGFPISSPAISANFNAAQVFDGNFNSFFYAADSSLKDWVGLDLGLPQTITQIRYAPRAGWEWEMYGGQFQVSSSSTFTSNVVNLFTINSIPVAGQFTTVTVNPGGAYRYVRYVGGNQWVDIAEMEVDGYGPAVPASAKLSGYPISTPAIAPAYNASQAFDGNLTTFFYAADSSLNDWVGLDLGSPQTITQIQYAPRAGWEWQMYNGQFQASSTANFTSNVVTLFTVSSIPVSGQLTSVAVDAFGAYQYVRYVGGTQWVDIAEMQVDGYGTPPPASTKLSGTAIGTPGISSSYSAAQAFDGNLNTFYYAADSSLTDWVGLDLGSARTITQIAFAPRAGWEWEMYGGQFQVSTTADFSSNVQTIYTVTSIPVSGQLTTINVDPLGTYEYIRFVGGTQWVDIAEMQVFGY